MHPFITSSMRITTSLHWDLRLPSHEMENTVAPKIG